jgi:polyribonucleotide nucleotidyltransferase
VSDDGMVGTVSIGSKDGAAVDAGGRRIMLILEPPTAELGATYTGRVVNITKFGAFVNILPGRDGLVHISKLGRGKRIERVEDVLSLGDELQVRVDDIDNAGKLSLSIVGDEGEGGGDGGGGGASEGASTSGNGETSGGDGGGRTPAASFEDFWEDRAKEEFGDLGPAEEHAGSSSGGAGRGGDRRGGRGGRGGRDRRPRR